MLDIDDTIVAIASPTVPAVRGIVRLSGPQVIGVLGKVGLQIDRPSAHVIDTEIDVAGMVAVQAAAGALLAARVQNRSESAADGGFSAAGLSFGAVVAKNKVSSAATARIGFSEAYTGSRFISAGAGVTVAAV